MTSGCRCGRMVDKERAATGGSDYVMVVLAASRPLAGRSRAGPRGGQALSSLTTSQLYIGLEARLALGCPT